MTQVKIQQREYQQRDIKSIEEAWKDNDGVMFQLPTGGGKSVIATQVVVNHRQEKILILAHRRRLLFQLRDHLAKQGIKAGMLVAEIEENLDSNIIIASIRTIVRDKRQSILEKEFDKVIIDEAHHSMTGSYQKLLDKMLSMHKFKLLGITATPYRNDLLSFEKYYSKLICSDDTQSLINQGYLSDYKVFYNSVDNIDSEVEKVGEEYQITSLSNYMRREKYINKAIEAYKENGEEKQTIVFCVDRKHAKDVQLAFEKVGYKKTGYIDSEVSEQKREQILQDFADKKLQFIFCIETLTEGVDLPETGCILLLRPTNSLVLYLQMVGRGLRVKSDNSSCIILDCSGATVKHGTPSSPKQWSLDNKVHPNKPRTKRKVVVRKKDGTFTEDDSEMEFGELVELSEEEYILNIADSIEKFEEENRQIDENTKTSFIELLQWVVEKSKLSNVEIKTDRQYISLNSIGTIKITDAPDYTFEIVVQDLREKGEKYISFTSSSPWSSSSTRNFYVTQLQVRSMSGKLADFLLQDSTQQFILKRYSQIATLYESKHNIQELESLVAELKESKFIRSLEEHISKYGEIEIEFDSKIPLDVSNLNRNWYTSIRAMQWHRREPHVERYKTEAQKNCVQKIVFSKKKLSQYNDATFYNYLGEEIHHTTNQNLYKEKLIEELRRIKWSSNKE